MCVCVCVCVCMCVGDHRYFSAFFRKLGFERFSYLGMQVRSKRAHQLCRSQIHVDVSTAPLCTKWGISKGQSSYMKSNCDHA